MILDARNFLRTDLIIAGMIIIGLIGLTLDRILVYFENKVSGGFSITPYIGILLIPYISYTFVYDKNDIYEIGSYLKLPVQINGKGYDLQ